MSDAVEKVKAMKHLQQAYSYLRNAEQAFQSVEEEAPEVAEQFGIKERRRKLVAPQKETGSNILVLRESIQSEEEEEDDDSEQQDDRDIEDRGIDRGSGLGDLGALQ
jgi:hypothetical protein